MTHNVLRFLLWLAVVCGTVTAVNPGLKLRLSQQGLDYAAGQAIVSLSSRVQGQSIPDQHGHADVSVGGIDYDITNMRIASFSSPTAHVTVQPGHGVTMSLSSVGASVHGDWQYKYRWHFVKVSDHGSFDITVTGAAITVGVTLGLDSVASGRPTITSTSCSSNVDNLKVKFHGGASWIYNLFDHNIAKALKGSLNSMLCKAARDAIDVDGAKALSDMKVQVPLGGIALLDYRLTSAPVFGTPYVDAAFKGEVFWKGDTTEAPFTPAPLPDPPHTTRMVSFWVSEYLMNTMGYAAQKHGLLVYTLTAQDLPEKDRGMLNTTCSSFICIGKLVPLLSKEYPNCSMEVKMMTTQAPNLTITPSAIQGRFNGTMDFYARMKNQSKVFVFTAYVDASLTLTIKMQGDKIAGNVTNISPTITVKDPNIPVAGLQLFFTFAANGFIKPKLNELANQGFELPTIPGLQFVNPSLTMQQNAVFMMTDVKYDPKLRYRPRM